MKNFKGFHLTEEGEDIVAQRELERKETRLKSRNNHKRNKVSHYTPDENDRSDSQEQVHAVPADHVSRFIDEGNSNTQAPVAFDADKPGTQPTEVPDIGKPDPETPPPRGEEINRLFGLYPTDDEFVSAGEEESAETIEEELGEVPLNFTAKYYYADQQLTEDITDAIRKEGSLVHVYKYIGQLVGLNHLDAIGHQLATQVRRTRRRSCTRQQVALDVFLDVFNVRVVCQPAQGLHRHLDRHCIHAEYLVLDVSAGSRHRRAHGARGTGLEGDDHAGGLVGGEGCCAYRAERGEGGEGGEQNGQIASFHGMILGQGLKPRSRPCGGAHLPWEHSVQGTCRLATAS